MATINGTTGNDTLNGTSSGDTISGAAGNDSINANNGNDYVDGGAGNDTINGGSGNDTLLGGLGDDSLDGGTGNDSLLGGDGADTLSAGTGYNTVYGGAGNDVWLGGDSTVGGTDLVYLEDGDDLAYVGWFNSGSPDTLDGGTGNDTLSLENLPDNTDFGIALSDDGSATTYSFGTVVRNFENVIGNGGDNALTGNSAANMLDGGAGNDTLLGNAGNDSLYGGAGADSVDGGADDDLITGDAGNDTLLGGAGNDTISGGADQDSISGGDGDDLIDGGTGNDTLLGGAGADTISGGAGADSIRGEDGNDHIDGGTENDTISGGAGNDTILGGDGADRVSGDDGDDSLEGGAGNDSLYGGNGNDLLHGGTGADLLDGGAGMDYADYSDSGAGVNVDLHSGTASGGDAAGDTLAGIDGIYGSAFDDTLTGYDGQGTTPGDAFTNVFYGNAGNDYLNGGGGGDSLYGGADDDTVLGGAGNDYIDGGSGNNSLDGGTGSDTIVVHAGSSGVVNGSEDADNGDVDVLLIDRDSGTISYDANNPENGTITWADGSTVSFSNIEHVAYVPCFTPGTLIETKDGMVPVESLVPGQRVLTRDNGYREIRWIGRRDLSSADLAARPELQPVRIRRGALGQGLPAADMVVSPQHRMLLTGPRAELYFGEAEVLAAALHMVGQPGIERLTLERVSYIHLMCDAHEIILADGAWTESFQPGDQTLRGLDGAQRDELFAIFPELARRGLRDEVWGAARRSLKAHEVRVLLAA